MRTGRWKSSRVLLRALVASGLICSHAHVRSQPLDAAILRAIDREARAGASGHSWLTWSTAHIGHRLTGTAHGRRAEESADSLFHVAGVRQVDQLPFSAPAWQRGSIEVLLLSGTGGPERLDAVALAMTPDSAFVQATVVDVGNGLTADFAAAGASLQGNMALVNLGLLAAPTGASNLHRSEKTALALQYGAVGVLFVNNVPGHVLLTGTASTNSRPVPIPAACISQESGERVRAQLAAGEAVEASIRMRNTNAPVTARNVVATIPGTTHADEVVIVGGHLDCWDLATGATDNGLGAYSILDLARCYMALGLKPARTIQFVLFMGEEQGLLGSTAFVADRRARGDLAQVKCMINLDMSGHPRGFNVFGPPSLVSLVRETQAAMHALDTTFRAESSQSAGLHSDHQPFMLAGIPVIAPICDLGGHVYHCYHSSCDDIGLVEPAAMVDNVRRVGQLLWALANVPELPGGLSDGELRDRLRADGLEEKLRLQGEWRW